MSSITTPHIPIEVVVKHYEKKISVMREEMENMEVALMYTGFYDDETEPDFIDESKCSYSADPPMPPPQPASGPFEEDIESYITCISSSLQSMSMSMKKKKST